MAYPAFTNSNAPQGPGFFRKLLSEPGALITLGIAGSGWVYSYVAHMNDKAAAIATYKANIESRFTADEGATQRMLEALTQHVKADDDLAKSLQEITGEIKTVEGKMSDRDGIFTRLAGALDRLEASTVGDVPRNFTPLPTGRARER